MQSNKSHKSLRPFGWCVVLLLLGSVLSGCATIPGTCTSGDCVNGQGTYTRASGDKYVGEYRDDERHGQGTRTFADGRVDAGIWENGKFIETFAQVRQRKLQEEVVADARRAREAVARKQREEEESRRDRIYNTCILDNSDGVDMSVRSLDMAVRETCIEISKNPSWLDKFRYN